MGKESLLQDLQNNVTSRRESYINYKELDQALSQWAREMKASEAIITSKMAQQKAEELAQTLGLDLKPSPAWLYKWKERENIKFAKKTKDPVEILKEFLHKRDRKHHSHHKDQQEFSFKRIKLVAQDHKNEEQLQITPDINEESNHEHILPGPITAEDTKVERTKATEETKHEDTLEKSQQMDNSVNATSESVQEHMEDTPHKPKQKREYTKRLPMIDASGVVYRCRKEKTFLTLLQKLEILQRIKNGERRHDLIAEYKLSQSAMSQIVNDEDKILKLAAGGQNLQMKRIRLGIFKDGEAELNAWVYEQMDKGESLTRTQIKNRAKEIAERLNIDFKASTGWLEKWKARMNMDFNENQVLQKKPPKFTPNGEEEGEMPMAEISYDQTSDQEDYYHHYQQPEIKTELLEHDEDYHEDMDTNDEFSYNEQQHRADIKPELLTPQQFYLQTIRADSKRQEEQAQEQTRESEEETDIKPFAGLPPHLAQVGTEETLHEKVLKWLNKYNIPPKGASELLNILQPHLNEISTAPCSSSTPISRRPQTQQPQHHQTQQYY